MKKFIKFAVKAICFAPCLLVLYKAEDGNLRIENTLGIIYCVGWFAYKLKFTDWAKSDGDSEKNV